MTGGPMNPQELETYMSRVGLIREVLNRLGRGAQQEAAFDIRVSPSLVSSIVRGRYIDEDKVTQLEVWVERKLRDQGSSTSSLPEAAPLG